MREINLFNVDLQVFNHLQKCFSKEPRSIDIKSGVVNFIRDKKDIAFKYKTQSDFQDFVFPNVNQFLEMRKLCGVNSKTYIDDNNKLQIKSKRLSFDFNETHSINLLHPNTHQKEDKIFRKFKDDIVFKISSDQFEDIRKWCKRVSKVLYIKYLHLFTNLAGEICIANEAGGIRHTTFQNTFVKCSKDFYLIFDFQYLNPFKYLLRDNYEICIRPFGEKLDAFISFHNLSIPLVTSMFCRQKEKNYCPSGDFNKVVTGFEPIQEEPKIEKTEEPVSTELEGIERFYK